MEAELPSWKSCSTLADDEPGLKNAGDGHGDGGPRDASGGYAHRSLITPDNPLRSEPEERLAGDGYGTSPKPIAGDGYTPKTAPITGDGYAPRPTPDVGDGYAPTPKPISGDGFGTARKAVAGDGHGTAPKPIEGDGYVKSMNLNGGAAEGPISGDGFHDDIAETELNNLSDFVKEVDKFQSSWIDTASPAGRRTTTPSQPATESGEGIGFSALDLRDRVVIMLLFKQVVQIEQVEEAWRRWQKKSEGKSKEPLWRVLTMDSSFDRDKIFAEAAQVYAFKEVHVDRPQALKFIKGQKETFTESQWERMAKLHVVPISYEAQPQTKEKRMIFISYDPSRPDVNRLMRELRLESFELRFATELEVTTLIGEAFPKRNEYLDRVSDETFAYDLGTSYDAAGTTLIDEDALEAEISRSSLINLFEAALVEAVRRGASDIHIFPNTRKQIEIHFRHDGELECWHREERVHPEAFLAVVKDNTINVDRFERDAAQDGFIQRKVDDTIIRYRVSVLPIANSNQEIRSESIVIRVLDDRKVITDLTKLGLLKTARERFDWAIRQPHGMVILTGPTGSGKSTTLFAALHQVVTPKLNVLTVEDPVEYVIPGVRQIKLSHKLGLEQAIRAILRHDPDIVMVGEMRDKETAELAIKLANTGHLTFSTLHTNDAASAISRLYKMGIEPFLIAYAINLIVAQRLVRKLCDKCKRPQNGVDSELLMRLGFTSEEIASTTFFDEGHDPKCRACGGAGYKGRRAITETMPFSSEIRRRIVLAK
ncbi:MAG: GspE/PulE family protein [Rhodothermales bacterium]